MNPVFQSFRALKRLGGTVWGKASQTTQLHTDTWTLGNRNADWTICRSILPRNSVVYSFGVGEDISFDLELIKRFRVVVHAFDPTPRSVKWIKAQAVPTKFVFHPYGVGAVDGSCKFSPPRNPQHVSHSLIQRNTAWPTIEVRIHRLTTILRMLGHKHLDLLKMDIEGAEYDVIDDLLTSDVQVGQLLVEFHHRWREVGPEQTRRAVGRLNDAGYRIFHVSPSGDEYSFLNVDSGTHPIS